MKNNGVVLLRGDSVFLSAALEGETVLLEPVDPDHRFLDFLIGRIDSLYGTTKDVTLAPRGDVSHVPGPMGDEETAVE